MAFVFEKMTGMLLSRQIISPEKHAPMRMKMTLLYGWILMKRKEKGFVEHDYDPLKEIGVLYGVDLESK